MNNCINCGAPINGNKCEYCGTVYRDRRGDEMLDEIRKINLELRLSAQMQEISAAINKRIAEEENKRGKRRRLL